MKRISLALAGLLLLPACGNPTGAEEAAPASLRMNSGVNGLGGGLTTPPDLNGDPANTTTAGDSANVTGRGVNGLGSG